METYTAPVGLPPLNAWASEIMYVKFLARFLAHGRHLTNWALIIMMLIVPVSSVRGLRVNSFFNLSTLILGARGFPVH